MHIKSYRFWDPTYTQAMLPAWMEWDPEIHSGKKKEALLLFSEGLLLFSCQVVRQDCCWMLRLNILRFKVWEDEICHVPKGLLFYSWGR